MADKLILSRKGFDAQAGEDYSPYNPVTGRYIVLPIPGKKNYPQMKTFNQIKIPVDYLNIANNADNLRDLLSDKKLRMKRKTIAIVSDPASFAHFDPMLGPAPWNNQESFSACAYGQANQAATVLDNQGVGPGSLFLFFSRFKPVTLLDSVNNNCLPWSKGAYYIYGWMRVGEVAKYANELKKHKQVVKYHHHAYMFGKNGWKNNTIFTPAEKLFPNMDIPGCGYFATLNEVLNLSCPHSQQKPSLWKLPDCFAQPKYRPTYLGNRIEDCTYDRLACCVNTAIQGQEFVTELSAGRLDWVKEIFKKNKTNIYRC